MLILAESAALLIGLAMPLTPSKTGSTWSLAHLFTPAPSYITEALVYFLFTNVVILLFGVVLWVVRKGM